MKFNFLRIAFVSFLAFLAVVFSACDVGLGEAVDTEKPTISIEYPPKNVVIKEDFVISGKCHDETSMKSVTLAFQNSESEHVEKFTATLAQDKNSWSARINEYASEKGKYPLTDGTYFVTAVATDSSGRQQEDKMTLRIDNTPPMIVLTNPGTVENKDTPLEKAGGFGATIKIQGSVNDFSVTDNDSGSKLVFTVFDENDKFLAYRELSNIPPSLGIIIGEYTDGTENLTDSNQFYKKIYGAAGSVVDTKYRKFKITVSDSARTYKGSAVNNERGNISECYYLKDEIYTDVNNKFSIGNSDLYEIIKKQAGKTGELTDHEKTILSSLEKFRHDSDDEYEGSGEDDSSRAAETSGTKALKIKPVGTFFLNPKNNPSYEITSFDAFDFTSEKKWEERKISTSGNITLLAKSGLSEAPLEADSFKVVLFKTDENGIRIQDTEAEKNEDKEIPCEWTKNGSNYTGRVTLSSKYVEVAQCYGIELKGHDKAGLEFYNGSKAYRFSVQTGSTPPDVKIEKYSSTNSGSTVYIKKNDSGVAVDLVIYGTAESRSGSKKGHVTLWPVVNGDKTQYANRDNKFTTKSNSEKDWSITVPGAYFNNKESDTYTVALYASDEISNETYKEITVIFDKENPKVQINSVDNVVVFDSETTIAMGGGTLKAEPNVGYVNDVITVSGNVSDNDAFDKGSWKAMCGETEIAGGVLSSSQIKITIDTKTDKNGNAVDFEGKNLELKFTVFDRAGNKTDYEYKYPDKNGKPLVISQLTDYPRVNLSNAELTVTTEDGIAVGKNLFDQTGNNKITGSVVDDDGIKTIDIQYAKYTESVFNSLLNNPIDCKGKTSWSFNQELKDSGKNVLAEGNYKIKIIATDINGKQTELEPFAVCISNSAPSITFTNPLKNTASYQAENFTVKGTVSGQFKLDGASSGSVLKRGEKTVTVNADGTWEDKISYDVDLSGDGTPKAGSGIAKGEGVNYRIEYVVTDRFNRETKDFVEFLTDYTKPVVNIDDSAVEAYIGKTKTTLHSFSGTVTEENALKSLEYSIIKPGETPVEWTSIPAQKTFNANIDFKDIAENDVEVCFRATDAANNISVITNDSKRKVKIIENAPTIDSIKISGDSKQIDSIYYVKDNYKISGKSTSAALNKVTGANKEWTSADFETDELSASGYYTFTAEDKAGQTASVSVSVVLDKDAPKPDFSQVSPVVLGYAGTPAVYKNGAVNGDITVQGTSSDNDKIVSTVLKIFKANAAGSGIAPDGAAIHELSYDGTGKTGDAISVAQDSTANNFKFTVDTAKLTDKEGIILRLVSVDRAGNEGFLDYPVFVCQETDIPTLKFNNGDVTCTDENAIKVGKNLFGMGSDTLYINVADDDGVASVTYTVDGAAKPALLTGGKSTTADVQINVSALGNGVHSLVFTVTDVNGKNVNFPSEGNSSIKIAYDSDVPEISVLKLGDVTYTSGCFAKEKFKISGEIKDSSGTVEIYEKAGGAETKVSEITDCSAKKTWVTEEITNNSGDITKTFVAKDKYGREKTLEINYKVDNVPPVFVSDYISITGETVGGSKTYVLGGTGDVYNQDNVWFTGSSFTLKGGDGTNSKIPVTEKNNFEIKLYKGSYSEENLISTIQPSGNNNFSGTVDVGGENASTIILVAVDEAKNKSTPLSVQVNVDRGAPLITNKEIYLENPNTVVGSAQPLPEKGYVNKDSIFVKFVATDLVSKVKSVEIYKTAALKERIGLKEFSPAVELASDVIEIDISRFDSKEYDLYIKVTDVAGNSYYTDLPNFIFDKNPPVVTYSRPAANSDVNKRITIEGLVDDLNPPATNADWSWALKVKKPGGTSFENVTGVTFDTSLETGKFKVSGIDTEKIGEGTAEFIVIATDRAGNTISEAGSNAKTLTLKIDQNSDRPVIQLSTISTDGNTTLSSGEISGTISDDDGIKKIEIQMLKKSGISYANLDESAWEEATLNGSNWTFKYSGTDIDGDYKLYFRVTDSADGVFTSAESKPANAKDEWACPRIQYQGKNEVCSAISFSIDSNPPTIKYFKFATSKDGNSWEEWKDLNNNQLFGGVKYRYAKFRILSYDTVSEQEDLSVSINISEIKKKYTYKKGDSSSAIKLTTVSESIDGKTYYYFESDTIDLNPTDKSVPTKSYTIEVEAKDKAEKPKTMSLGIIIDNTAPTSISKLNHSSNDELTGDIVLSGQVSDDSSANSGIAEMYYAVPYTNITAPENLADYNKDSESFGTMWFKVDELTSVVWNLTVKTDYIYTKEGSNIVMKNGYIGYQNGSSGIYNLPVWFKIVDNAGNVGYNKGNLVRYNPDADKPRVAITYPVHNVKDSSNDNFSYVIIGGTIRFTGTAEDDEGIQAVYLQFDMDGDGIYENGVNVDGCPPEVKPEKIPTSAANEQGVLVKGTNSWSYSLKVSGLKNLLYSENNKKVLNVRAVALDTGTNDSPLLGAWSEPIHISVNNDVPAFESVKIAQYSGNSSSDTEVKSVEYQDDKYISGTNWYLVGKVSSNAGISEIAVEGATNYTVEIDTSSGTPVVSGDTGIVLDKTESGGNINELTYKIPVNGTSRWEARITVTDNASEGSKKANYLNYSLNIDNTPPQFFDIRNKDEEEALGTIKLYKGGYGSSGVILDDKNFVQNSNGFFTLAGRVTEAGSGYENVIFYFKRVPSETTAQNPARVYNPMESHGDSNKDNRADITAKTAENGKVYINSDSLPVLHASSVAREPDNEYTLISGYVTNNKNVRVGGLVKIGGLYRKISAVDYASGKVTFDSACAQDYREAEFVYGMVIDNSGESLNYDNSIKNDDGDGMVESFAKSGSNYTWDASVDSTNIPDGPIEIHVVVFDKAGNSNHGYVKTSVSNNAPRIARVRLATDLNSNGIYEENESKVFAWLDEDTTKWDETTKSSGTEIWNLDAEGWTIKNNLQVEPEFVGGTAPFYYVFSKESGAGNAKNLTSPKTDSFNASDTRKIAANRNPFVISNSSFDSSEAFEDKINTYQFSFWDSTEETVPGKDSQWTVLNAQLKQDIEDSNAPKVVVSPFYWNDSEDNSLYENSLLNGHIELEDDWKNASGYNGSTTGLYDGDPKVSGKIVIRGTAYDDVFLSSLWIKFGKGAGTTGQNFTFTNYLTDAGFGSAGTSNGYVQAAFYENGWKKASATMEADGWKFDVSDDYFDQNGHKVNWTLSIDTSKLSGIAGTDIEFKVMAVDHVKNDEHKSADIDSSAVNPDGTTNTADNVYNKPAYRMDVVPYITGVKTYLSKKLKTSIVDAYTRTTLGHYIISDRENSIELEGFNLGDKNTVDATASGFTSREYVVLVNEVETLNNKNNNNACGSYKEAITEDSKYEQKAKYAYNRQPVEKSNHLLTDDIYFDVWEFDSDAAIPMSGKLSEPVMKINPSNGKIGFAFVSGPADFSMADGRGLSYKNYQRNYATFSNISMAFDDKGNSYGTATGLDTYPSGATDTLAGRFTFMTSRWGTDADSMDDNYNYENKLRLEAIGLPGSQKCYVKGTYPSTYTMTETRFSSPSLAVASHGDTTSVYLAYYDDIQSQIRFRFGSNCPGSKGDFNNFVDNEGLGDVISNKYNNDNGNDKKRVFEANTSKFSLIAGVDWQKFSGSENSSSGITYKVGGNYFYDTGYAAGQYVAIDVIPGSSSSTDIVVAVWYDGSDCWYGYNTNPTSGKDNGIEGGWNCQKIFSDGGEFCTVKAGPDGSVHIAANVDGSLCYAYLSSYAASYNEATDSVIVDSFTITGEQINIDVGRRKVVGDGSVTKYYVIPYISYYVSAAKMPAIASLVIPVSGVMDYTMQGTVNDVFTGGWEVSLVPTDSTMSGGANDKVNIGLWKKTLDGEKGVIVKSTDLNTETSSRNVSNVSSGNCYGNGTDNAVLGYAVKTSSGTAIETAQLK